MKKITVVVIALLATLGVQSQVIVTPQLPPLGLTIKPQLWNLSLVNSGQGSVEVKIEVSITDVSTSQLVLTGTSRIFLLPAGTKQIRVGDVLPVTYTLGSPGYSVDPSPNGFLPSGNFSICYSVIKVNIDAPELLAEECETVEVEPLSPPQLVLPLDDEEINVLRPLFSWLPPFPFNAYTTLQYDWILVEVQPTQSATDAIQQNIPVLTRQNIRYTSLQYPLSMPELDTSKLYAWRVTAKNNISPIANSETWTFRVKQYQADSIISNNPEGFFARLHREEDAAFIICNGVLRFEYMHENTSSSASITIFDISNANRRTIPLDSSDHRVVYGQNFVQIDLRETNFMMNNHMYLLQLRNSKNEIWYLKFEFRRQDD